MRGVVCVVVCVLLLWRIDGQLNCDPQSIMLGGDNVGVVGIQNDYAIIGVPEDRQGSGTVNIYEKDPSDGKWKVAFLDNNLMCDKCHLGQGVAISERLDIAIAGAPAAPGGGQVFVYRRTGSLNPGGSFNWKLIDTLNPSDVDPNPENVMGFGSAISIGNGSPKSQSSLATVVIGAAGTKVGDNEAAGSVYVLTSPYPFTSSPPTWNVSYSLYGNEKNGQLGYSSAISNSATNVVVGEPGGVGKVHIIVANPVPSLFARTWTESQVLTALYPNSGYGMSVATWGSTTEDGNTAWSEQGALSGFPIKSAAQYWDTTTYNDAGVDYNQTLLPTHGEPYFGTSVSADHNNPGGCILPIVSSASYFHYLPPSSSSHTTLSSDRERAKDDGESYVYSFMYHNGYGNPWIVNTTISSSVLPSGCDASGFGQVLLLLIIIFSTPFLIINSLFLKSVAVSNGTAIIASGGCFTIWCTGVVCG